MIIDSVVEDFWYGPKSPKDDQLWAAVLERCSYANSEGYSTPVAMDSRRMVAAIRNQLNISYINQPDRDTTSGPLPACSCL